MLNQLGPALNCFQKLMMGCQYMTMMLDLQMGAANHQRIGQIMMVLQSTIRQIDSLD
jgi:hypothetical protein